MTWRAHGMRAWLLQRLSAAYLATYIIASLILFMICPVDSYTSWRDAFANPVMNIGTLLFFVALLIHAWVGMRDILIDYVHPTMLRFALLNALMLALLSMGIWVTFLLFSVIKL